MPKCTRTCIQKKIKYITIENWECHNDVDDYHTLNMYKGLTFLTKYSHGMQSNKFWVQILQYCVLIINKYMQLKMVELVDGSWTEIIFLS